MPNDTSNVVTRIGATVLAEPHLEALTKYGNNNLNLSQTTLILVFRDETLLSNGRGYALFAIGSTCGPNSCQQWHSTRLLNQ